jgi:hypothetical protein
LGIVKNTLAIGSMLAILLTVSIIQLPTIGPSRTSLRFVAYAPLESGANDLTSMLHDLQIAKNMGFVGVKLWDAPDLLRSGTLSMLLHDGTTLGLEFQIPILVNSPSTFPYDTADLNMTKEYLVSLTKITRTENVAYTVWMPYDFNNLSYSKVIVSSAYADTLNELIDYLHMLDPNHQVFAFTDANPSLGFPRQLNVNGYGVQPYSEQVNNLDEERIQNYLAYFSISGKTVFIDEWGLHTTPGLTIGRVTNAFVKNQLSQIFFRYCDQLKIFSCTYFLLVDSSLYSADWGLLNNNRSLRVNGRL